MRNTPKPQLITDAERSPEQELRRREIRYVSMMAIRAVCVILAAVLVMLKVPLLPLWLAICVAGAIILPWSAVLLANDRAPKAEHQLRTRFDRRTTTPASTAPASVAPALPEREHKIIDVDP